MSRTTLRVWMSVLGTALALLVAPSGLAQGPDERRQAGPGEGPRAGQRRQEPRPSAANGSAEARSG